ncbi:DUF3265 domain-containing protein [Vibrio parahaemolyticus]|nr:DUF3265 domain-containing protein [Vibrio parahaemolyticus]HCE5295619.1 DUF3265 domain-containing protein [Vibrio parahaemolyticus]
MCGCVGKKSCRRSTFSKKPGRKVRLDNIFVCRDTGITNCLRGIRNAWHFHYALFLVFKAVCGGICIALLTP